MTFWVFGYGSLLWNPGFEVAQTQLAHIDGWHRSFCMRSIHHRGTPENPGLVLALDRAAGASCAGLALQVAAGHEDRTLEYLRERELVSAAYVESWQDLRGQSGQTLRALTFVIDPDHVQYCGGLDLDEQARIIARSVGGRGPNSDYLFNTAAHLDELGIPDPDLHLLAQKVRGIMATA